MRINSQSIIKIINLLMYLFISTCIIIFLSVRIGDFFYVWKKITIPASFLFATVLILYSLIIFSAYKFKLLDIFPFYKKIINNRYFNIVFNSIFILLSLLVSRIPGKYLVDKNLSTFGISRFLKILWIGRIGSIMLLLIFLILIVMSLREVFTKTRYDFNIKENLPLFLLLTLIINLSAAIYLANTCTVYYWDTAGYWNIAGDMSSYMFAHPGLFISNVYNSILTLDYNYMAAVPIAFFMSFLGTSRLVFIICIINIYLVPGIFTFILISCQINNKTQITSTPVKTVIITLLFIPALLFLTFAGYLDVGGIPIMVLILLLYFNDKTSNIKKYFVIGFLLSILYLFRRWYLFWIISFIICVIIHQGIKFFAAKFKNATPGIGAIVSLLASFTFILFFFAQPLVLNKLLLYNYSDSYSAYDLGISYDYFSFVRHFGIIIFLIIAACSIYLILNKKLIIYPVFLLGQSALCFILFRRVQSHSQQHFLLYIPCMFILIMLTINHLLTKQWNKKAVKYLIVTGIILLGTVNTGITLIKTGEPQPETTSEVHSNTLFPNFKLLPGVRYDTAELLRLANYMDKLSENSTKSIGILASSFAFNSDIFVNLESSLNIATEKKVTRSYLATIQSVDKKSGFPFALFGCDYVVVADPVQYHLNPKDQQVIVIPAESFLKNTDIANAFSKMPETFSLKNNIKVYIYKKERPITTEEKRELVQKLHQCYPDLPNLFPPPETIK